MFGEISYALFFGFPVIGWIGLTAAVLFALAFITWKLPIDNRIMWHRRFAIAGGVIILVHIFFGLSAYLF